MNLAVKLVTASLFASSAWASLIPSLSSVTPSGSNFVYNYNAVLSTDERLDPAATNGTTCPAVGSPVSCVPPGTFLTLYDFAGYTGASTAPANWTLTSQNIGITPSTVNGATFDDPNVVNLTFKYNGPVIQGPGSFAFSATSIYGVQNKNGNFTSQLTKSDLVTNPATNGQTDQITGPLSVPTSISKTPEPASMFMMGSGLLGLGFLVRRRKA